MLGARGHARVLVYLLQEQGALLGALSDIDARLHGTEVYGVPVIGDDEAVLARRPSEVVLVNAVGNAPGSGRSGLGLRRALFETFKTCGYDFAQVISSDAVISPQATLGEGVQAITRALVHPGVQVGDNTILNTGASIDHDCWIGPHSHIAPWAVLCGGVTVGSECHIGARSVLVPGVTIGDGAVVGAGAVVTGDVAAGATVVGNPAHVIHSGPVAEKKDSPSPTRS